MRTRRALILCAAAAAALSGWTPSASAQLRASTCQAASALGNGSFEQPVITAAAQHVLQGLAAPWQTTAINGRIELWRSGRVQGIAAAAGDQLTEIAGDQPATVTYQD